MVSLPGFLTDLNMLSIIVFITVVAYLAWRDRQNIERYGVVFVRRTKHGVDVLDDVANIMPRIWRGWSTVGIVVGFVLMVPFFVLVLQQTLKLFLVGDAAVPVAPILPTAETVTDPRQSGYFGLPFWPFMIAISVLLVVHEMMHGVIARVEDFEVEYVGLLLLAFIPGAFVQPKGQQDFFEDDATEDGAEPESPWDQGSWVSRLRVLAAGPWANVTLALILLALMHGGQAVAGPALADSGLYEPQGMRLVNVSSDSPAELAGLEPGMVVTAINGSDTLTTSQFSAVADGFHVGDQVTVETARNGTFTATLGTHPDNNRNATYNPAMVDYLLPWLEQRYPGSIDTYEQYNDVLTGELLNGDDVQLQLARWQWIKANYPALEDTADQHIQDLESQMDEPDDGFLGIRVQPEQYVDASIEPFVGAVQFLMLLVWAVAILNFFVGTANLLPIKGLDGGWMVSILLDHYAPEKEPAVTRFLTVTTIGMILISFTFLIMRFVL